MEYFFKIKKSNEFRYTLMTAVKECLLLQKDKEKIELIRQAKRDLFDELGQIAKEIDELTKKLDMMVTDEDLKKEIQEKKKLEQELEKEQEKKYEKQEKKYAPKIKEEKTQIKKEIFEETYKETEPQLQTKKTEPDELANFNYTLEQIEKKLAELKQD